MGEVLEDFFTVKCNPVPTSWKGVVETHADGGRHWHIIVFFDRAIRSRKADLFNIDGLHPNVVW